MLKFALATSILASLLAGPVFAQDTMMKCDNASMMKMQSQMDAMNDPAMKAKKAMAMKEMTMAKASMKAHKVKNCTMHMNKAMKEMGG